MPQHNPDHLENSRGRWVIVLLLISQNPESISVSDWFIFVPSWFSDIEFECVIKMKIH